MAMLVSVLSSIILPLRPLVISRESLILDMKRMALVNEMTIIKNIMW